jgi:hypothetical protein
MPRARATPGSVAIERLAHRGQGRVLHGSMTISGRSETVRGSTVPSVTVTLPEFGGVERTVGVALPSSDTGPPCESRPPSPADQRRTLPPRMPAISSSYPVGDRPGTRSPKKASTPASLCDRLANDRTGPQRQTLGPLIVGLCHR